MNHLAAAQVREQLFSVVDASSKSGRGKLQRSNEMQHNTLAINIYELNKYANITCIVQKAVADAGRRDHYFEPEGGEE